MENKRYVKRCILFNSAGFTFADICQDGHIDIAGGSGTGKSTLLNALLFPFLIDNELLNIGSEKEVFSKYYFKFSNSFIIYEIVNKKGAEYCAILHKTNQDALVFHLVNGAFDEGWLYNDEDGNEPVPSWDELARNIGPALARGSYNRETFNRVLFGVDTDYSEALSLMSFDGKKIDGSKATFGIRSMLSVILRNRELSQATLKKTLVDAVIAENQSKTDGIMLATHRKNLGDFIGRKHDIELATVRDKEGKTILELVSEEIVSMVDDYALTVGAINDTPGELAFAVKKAEEKETALKAKLGALEEKCKKVSDDFDARIESVSTKISEKDRAQAVAQANVDTLKAKEAKYKECDNVEDLAGYASQRKELENQRTQYITALSQLNKDSDDIRAREKDEIGRLETIYQDKINKSNNEATLKKDKLTQEKSDAIDAYSEECRKIQEAYRPEMEAASSNEADALELVLRAVRETESELTIEDVRESLNEATLLTGPLEEILSQVSSHHNPSNLNGEELKELEKKTIADYNDKRARIDILKRQREEEMNGAARKRDRIVDGLTEKIKKIEEKRKADRKTLEDEFKEKEKEVHQTYASLLSGNDAVVSSAISELKEKLDSVEYILQQLSDFPSVVEDYKEWLSRSTELRGELSLLTRELQALRKDLSDLKSEKSTTLKGIDAEITSVKADCNIEGSMLGRARQFIANRLSIREAIEGGALIDTEKSIADILGDYDLYKSKIDDYGRDIPRAVRHLFEPGMLTSVDTFSLGYGRTSTLEECLVIADNLRALLQETSSGETLLDSHIRSNASIWVHELQSISSEMGTIETNMSLLMEDCRKANRFMDANNTTDCCADIHLEIEENSSTDLLLILRGINDFWHTKGHLVGYDNLFVGTDGDNSANAEAMKLLKGFSEALATEAKNEIPLSEMFDVKMSFREKGNYHRNLMKFDNPASGSTNVMLKSIINIALLKILIDANRSNSGVALPIPVDEMNDISIVNLKAFINFANAAGMHLIFCGQHHTIPMNLVNYSYNAWDELFPQENGETIQYKWISVEGESDEKERDNE